MIINFTWHLMWMTEWIVDKTCPHWFRRWYFSHDWSEGPTKYNVEYMRRICYNDKALNRRLRLLSDKELNELIIVCKSLQKK